MTEIVFLVQLEPEGGYSAQALGAAIFTQADDMPTLREMVRDAVQCHFHGTTVLDQVPQARILA